MGYQNYSDTHSGSVGVNHLYVVHCLNLILTGSTLKLKEVLHQLRLGKTEVERSDIGQRDAVEIDAELHVEHHTVDRSLGVQMGKVLGGIEHQIIVTGN